MSYVDFKIVSIKNIESIQFDNVIEVTAYMYRGHYDNIVDEKNKQKNVYVRDEKFGEALVIFVPNNATETEINKELYNLLLENKQPEDEVIPECIY